MESTLSGNSEIRLMGEFHLFQFVPPGHFFSV
jgi:hypothetical protein